LSTIAQAAGQYQVATVVGLPLEVSEKLYNCAAFQGNHAVLGIVPKTYLPTNEYYEERWFSSSRECSVDVVLFDGAEIPFGTDLLFHARNFPGCMLGIEICVDVWACSLRAATWR
jgi:NAD+ synthase (glutamine-hydrolysing)